MISFQQSKIYYIRVSHLCLVQVITKCVWLSLLATTVPSLFTNEYVVSEFPPDTENWDDVSSNYTT